MPELDDFTEPVVDAATTEIGPLPVWGWGLAAVAGFFLGRAISSMLDGGSSGPGGPTVVGGNADGFPAGSGTVGGVVGISGTPEFAGDPLEDGYSSNDEWRAAAFAALIADGAGGTTSDRALGLYLEGAQLTADQDRLIEMALQTVGPPPFPPPVAPAPLPDAPDEPTPPIVPPTPAPTPSTPTPSTPTPGPSPMPQLPPRRPTPTPSTPTPSPAPAPAPAPVPTVPRASRVPAGVSVWIPGQVGVYTVSGGDTVSKVAARLGVSTAGVINLTRFFRPTWRDPNLIRPGDKLYIPLKELA